MNTGKRHLETALIAAEYTDRANALSVRSLINQSILQTDLC